MSTPKTEYNCFSLLLGIIMERRKYATLKIERVINNYHLQNYQIAEEKKKSPSTEAQGNETVKDR